MMYMQMAVTMARRAEAIKIKTPAIRRREEMWFNFGIEGRKNSESPIVINYYLINIDNVLLSLFVSQYNTYVNVIYLTRLTA